MSFKRRMQRRGKQVERNVQRKIVRSALRIHREVVLSTPVDTGLARSNWQVTTEGPAEGLAPIQEPALVLQAGKTALAGSKARRAYITNNVHYIVVLNQGHSPQASSGYVEAAIRAGALAGTQVRLFERG